MTQAVPTLRRERPDPAAFTTGVGGHDALARHWLAQVTLRLRREVCWLWRERGLQLGDEAVSGALPPPVDRALAALDIARYEHDRRRFFSEDVTAQHLSGRIAALPPPATEGMRGSFAWVADRLDLAPVECFVLALALLPSVDGAAGPVIASCQNDTARTAPTLALAQRLWDDPEQLLNCFDPAHPLLSHGLIAGLAVGAGVVDWQTPFSVPSLVARELLFAGGELPAALQRPARQPLPAALGTSARGRVAAALTASHRSVLPLLGVAGTGLAGVAATLVQEAGGTLVQPSVSLPHSQLAHVFTVAWLKGHALFVDATMLVEPGGHDAGVSPLPLPALPLAVIVGAADRSALRGLGENLPSIEVPRLSYAERLDRWRSALPGAVPGLPVSEIARRFRYEQQAIARVAAEVARLGRPATPEDLLAAARADLDLGALAQPVSPRFGLSELMLPAVQTRQIDEIVQAMHNLTRVHHEWGTAKAWNESGLTALFAGPPGTGKTMTAEAIGAQLALPLYRIDLSQVVNKYIGETEKNLRRLFDAADAADIILFFDEADALFGKRTEVKDAHDRYANLEISYLLERMERFRGLAILATNRKKDLDEAFLRRLRFVVEFPQPGPAERLRIWKSVIPPAVDASAVDFEFLAQRFALAGGHIRAIVFQACLQSADEGAARTLDMFAIVRAVQREYEKLDRANSLDQFGPYASTVAAERNQR